MFHAPVRVQTAVLAAAGLGVGLLAIIAVKKSHGQTDEEISDDLKRAVRAGPSIDISLTAACS